MCARPRRNNAALPRPALRMRAIRSAASRARAVELTSHQLTSQGGQSGWPCLHKEKAVPSWRRENNVLSTHSQKKTRIVQGLGPRRASRPHRRRCNTQSSGSLILVPHVLSRSPMPATLRFATTAVLVVVTHVARHLVIRARFPPSVAFVKPRPRRTFSATAAPVNTYWRDQGLDPQYHASPHFRRCPSEQLRDP